MFWVYVLRSQKTGRRYIGQCQDLSVRFLQGQIRLPTPLAPLYAWRDQLLPKHPMSLAVNYALNQWNELNVFVGDGAVPIDNNVSERDIKRIVLNRKNSLFVGNERGGRTAAILSSLTSTRKRHGIDPQRYLTQLLTNLPTTQMNRVSQWLPDNWQRRNAARQEQDMFVESLT
jgi:transposase